MDHCCVYKREGARDFFVPLLFHVLLSSGRQQCAREESSQTAARYTQPEKQLQQQEEKGSLCRKWIVKKREHLFPLTFWTQENTSFNAWRSCLDTLEADWQRRASRSCCCARLPSAVMPLHARHSAHAAVPRWTATGWESRPCRGIYQETQRDCE